MKLNNKGLSLMELLLSIVLIGIVLLFLFQLLTDLKGETESNNFVYNNQINRTQGLYKIASDINKFDLVGIRSNSTSKVDIDFIYPNRVAKMTIDKQDGKYYLNYLDVEGNDNKWEMKNANIDGCGSFTVKKNADKYYFIIKFYVYNNPEHKRNSKEFNNVIDDIELTKVGKLPDIDGSISGNMLNYENGVYQIGNCA